MMREISRNKVMVLLLEASPSYAARGKNYVQENYGEEEEKLLYIDLCDFAAHLADCFQKERLNEFPAVFAAIELLHTDGSEEVKEAATVGFLEDLQNQFMNFGLKPEALKPYLKNESLKWWNHLNDFWDGKTKYVGGPEK